MKRQWGLVCLLLIIPLSFLVFHLGDYPYPSGSSYSDFAITHDPYLTFLRSEIATNGEIPLWNPNIYSGSPFAANPLSSIAYPFLWIAVIMGSPFGLNLLTFLHLWVGGIGMILFLKNEGMNPIEAFSGGIAFVLMPKLAGHIGLGHVTLVWAVSWTPWLMWTTIQYWVTKSHLKFLLPILFLGLIMLADIRWFPYAGIFWAALNLRSNLNKPNNKKFVFFDWIKESAAVFAGALCLATPVIIPLIEFIGYSTRSQMTGADATVLGLPLSQLIDLLIPDFQGYAEWILYPGILVVLLVVWGITKPDLRKRLRIWLGLIFVSLILALSDYLPFSNWIAQIPGFNMLRVPSRSLFLLGIAFSVMAANCLKELRAVQKIGESNGLPVMGVAGLVLIMTFGLFLLSGQWYGEFVWAAIVAIIGAALILLRKDCRISAISFSFGVICLLAIDFAGVDINLLDYKTPSEVFATSEDIVNHIPSEKEPYRVFDYSYSIEPSVLSRDGIQSASGIDPMQIRLYAKYAREAAGQSATGYSVSIPVINSSNLEISTNISEPDAKMLGLLNVKYIFSRFIIDADNISLVERINEVNIYENEAFLPRAWIQDESQPFGENIHLVEFVSQKPNEILLSTRYKGLLVISVPYYAGWKAYIDNNETEVKIVAGSIMGINLPEGQHTVRLSFQPVSVFIGYVIGFISWVLVITVCYWRGKQK